MTAFDQAIPVIDISPLVASDPAGERDVARRIADACRGIGFFYILAWRCPRIAPASVWRSG